jgi:hypothetical protein
LKLSSDKLVGWLLFAAITMLLKLSTFFAIFLIVIVALPVKARNNGLGLFQAGHFKEAEQVYESLPKDELYANAGDVGTYLDTLSILKESNKGIATANDVIAKSSNVNAVSTARQWLDENSGRYQPFQVPSGAHEVRVPMRREFVRDRNGQILNDAYRLPRYSFQLDITLNGKPTTVHYFPASTEFLPGHCFDSGAGGATGCSKAFIEGLGVAVTGTPYYRINESKAQFNGQAGGRMGPFWEMKVKLQVANLIKRDYPISISIGRPDSFGLGGSFFLFGTNYTHQMRYFDFQNNQLVLRQW